MNTHKLTVGLIQQRCSADAGQNLSASIEGIRKAAARGARLVLLPELHNSLYFCQTEDPANFDLAETIPGPTTEQLGELAAEQGVVIVASIFEKRAAGLYHNTAVAIENDGRIAGCYRKMHIPDDPGYYEKFYFTPGVLGFNPVQTSVGALGILVCWDQWYPEAARLMALGGAQILLYPTAIGWSRGDAADEQARQRDAWLTIQRAHAIANGLPVLTCNRTGFETDVSGHTDGIQFWGSSAVFGPQGEIIEQATENEAGVVIAMVDLQRTEQIRRLWPYLRDRRIDAYQDLLRRYRD
jgi:N-carbamoylputrescine amidase